MDPIYVALLFLAALFLRLRRSSGRHQNLPPGPPRWPVVGNLLQVILQRRQFMLIVRDLREKYGPIFSLQMGQRTLVIITSSDLIHEALVQKGELFASRPPDSPLRLLFSVGKCTVNASEHGPLWRFLRRNFVNELINPNRVMQFGRIRRWAIENHLGRLRDESSRGGHVEVMSHCRLTISSILLCMCFGVKLSEDRVKVIESLLREIATATMPNLTDFFPVLTPLFRRRMEEAKELRRKQMEFMVPLIRNRKIFLESGGNPSYTAASESTAYVDSLLELEAGGKLREEEMVSLCSEAITGGTDTSSAVLEWALLSMVQNQEIQEKLYREIVGCVGPNGKVTESDVEKMPYLGAVIKETLRRHPPNFFVLPHAATKETELGGYTIPAGVNVEIYTPLLTEDPKFWQNPSEFQPERFLTGDGVTVDLTGVRGVKMLPFGAGRRICPAWSLGMLHISLLLANMIHAFKWIPIPDNPPDPTPFFVFSVVMKHPLKAIILAREATNI